MMAKNSNKYSRWKLYSDGVFKLATGFVLMGLLIATQSGMPDELGIWMALIPFGIALTGFADLIVGLNI